MIMSTPVIPPRHTIWEAAIKTLPSDTVFRKIPHTGPHNKGVNFLLANGSVIHRKHTQLAGNGLGGTKVTLLDPLMTRAKD